MLIKQQLIEQINQVLKIKLPDDVLTDPPSIEMGEFALPCFAWAKRRKKNPNQLAQEWAAKLTIKNNQLWDRAVAAGPYVNFSLRARDWNKAVLAHRPARSANQDRQKIMIEYSQPNTHKDFHVGHLRNACLGAALVNLYRYQQHKVVAATYVNDVGAHTAKCLWNFINYHASDPLPARKGKFLGQVYVEAVARLGESEELKNQVAEILQRLENMDPAIMKIWQKTRDWSLQDFRQIYDQLNIKFDQWYFESDILDAGKKIVAHLLKKKAAKKSQGAVIVDLKKYGLDVLVLLKSDGAALYSTSDLALAYVKEKKKLDQSIYVVDNRQSLYFKQLFKTLELAGFREKLIHVPYEFVTLPGGAMSSRKGNVISYWDFVDGLFDKVMRETRARHSDWPKDVINDTAHKISMAALKFGMLKYENKRVVVFDMDQALAFDGATGPYLLYTVARMNSIFRKVPLTAGLGRLDLSLLKEIQEKELIKQLSQFDAVIAGCVRDNQPAYLCTYLLELAQKFNTFYHQHSISRAELKLQQARLLLLKAVHAKMAKGLSLLNIETVEQM